ncbi:MAG: preprotein translocase subunit YajC [Clostridia bacterium]|nr:preprotein translocase subunit YajC [Clostridia bacterium]
MQLALLEQSNSGGNTTMGTIMMIGYIVVIGLVFYFLMIRPQKKKQKKEQEMRNSIQMGDEILTIGGFYCKVVSIKEDSFVVESPIDHSKMRVAKWAVQSNQTIHE